MFLIWLVVAVVVVLLAMSAHEKMVKTQKHSVELENAIEEAQNNLAMTQTLVASQTLDKALEKETNDLRILVESRQKMADLLDSKKELRSHGYAGFMRGLASTNSADVSVSSFSLEGLNANISGVAKNPNSVPLWIKKFKRNDDLRNITFGAISMSPDEKTNTTKFNLSDSNSDDKEDGKTTSEESDDSKSGDENY